MSNHGVCADQTRQRRALSDSRLKMVTMGLIALLGASVCWCAEPPSVAPTGSDVGPKLCFVKKNTVYVAGLDGSQARKVFNARQIADVKISPDGNAIAFTQYGPEKSGPGDRDIAVYDLGASQPRVLRNVPGGNNYGPIWSPDGKWLMFSHYAGNGWHISVVRPDGTGFRDVSAGNVGKNDSLFAGWWAKDCRSLFAYDFQNFHEIGLDGQEIRKVPFAMVMGDASPASGFSFSLGPDGRLLMDAEMEVADIKTEEGPPVILLLRDDATSTTKRASPKGMLARMPCWSPDGKSFVFCGGVGGSSNIYSLDLATSKTRTLVKGADSPSVAPGPVH